MSSVKHRWYWGLQLTGWLACAVSQLYAFTTMGTYLPSVNTYAYVGSLVLAALAFTHAYRFLILRYHLLTRPLGRQVLVATLAMISMSLALQSIAWLRSGLMHQDWHAYTWQTASFGVLTMGRYLTIWLLAYHLFAAGEQVTRTEVRHLRAESALHQARYDALRAQVNPHFLFNALNSVRALTLTQPHAARTAVTQLAELLRYTLQLEQRPRITLREEMAAVQDYLALEQTRFGTRLLLQVEVPAAALAWLVPPVTVLTLVENAVKHGIAAQPAGGTLTIRAAAEATGLVVEVGNPGQLLPVSAAVPGLGLGLHNTRKRLVTLYGPRASLVLLERTPGNIVATLQLPATLTPAL